MKRLPHKFLAIAVATNSPLEAHLQEAPIKVNALAELKTNDLMKALG
jgi:hypothetical protein